MFEEQAIEITAQVGTTFGVEKEERLTTPIAQSFKYRHPWLQLNLLTAFVAATVVGVFQQTLDQLVVLAVFLPVLAGQSGNTGCQALAVTVRGIKLRDAKTLETELRVNRPWLERWEATLPGTRPTGRFDTHPAHRDRLAIYGGSNMGNSGGPMFDMGPYYLSALVQLLGPIRSVTGAAR